MNLCSSTHVNDPAHLTRLSPILGNTCWLLQKTKESSTNLVLTVCDSRSFTRAKLRALFLRSYLVAVYGSTSSPYFANRLHQIQLEADFLQFGEAVFTLAVWTMKSEQLLRDFNIL